jgi:glycosyltransferase involved in cell wall biosynthesis
MRGAAGLQCNGLPAYRRYGSLSPNSMLYFDTRLTSAMQITPAALADKQANMRKAAPLRLAFSGRLDRMKGVHTLVPLMRKLKERGVDFIFEIFGSGALTDELAAAAAGDLAGKLILHGPVPFAEELVPAMKDRIDLFICPHPQGDPSCTYMETLGCGVPIIGFDNEAWAAMVEGQRFGEVIRMNEIDAMASVIQRLDRARDQLGVMAQEAALFSSTRTFEAVFADRLVHSREIAQSFRK